MFISDVLGRPGGGQNDIAYMLTIGDCPADISDIPAAVVNNDIYYDAYAVLRHGICSVSTESEELILGAPPATKYTYTMFAAIHPESVVCPGPNGDSIDMITTLQDLGYYPKIW